MTSARSAALDKPAALVAYRDRGGCTRRGPLLIELERGLRRMRSSKSFAGVSAVAVLGRLVVCVVVASAVASLLAGAGHSANARKAESCSAIYMPYGCNLYFTISRLSMGSGMSDNAPYVGGGFRVSIGGQPAALDRYAIRRNDHL